MCVCTPHDVILKNVSSILFSFLLLVVVALGGSLKINVRSSTGTEGLPVQVEYL